MIKFTYIILFIFCISNVFGASTQIGQLQLQEKETALIMSKSLDAMTQAQGESQILSLPNTSRWKMEGFTTDIAMTAEGTIGVLGGGEQLQSLFSGEKNPKPPFSKSYKSTLDGNGSPLNGHQIFNLLQ